MKKLLLSLFFLASPAFAQADWTQCANENETCTFAGSKLVRYGQPWTPAWTAEKVMISPVLCNNVTFVDPSPGTGKRCEIKDAPVSVPPPVVTLVPWGLEWTHATTNTDGSPLVDRTGYRVESLLEPSGSWSQVQVVGADVTQVQVSLSSGTRRFRVTTLSSSGESVPSGEVTASKNSGTVPSPPGDVGVWNTELQLVTGTTNSLRAVYSATSTRSRGVKIGDLLVGPTTQTDPPFNRVKCDRKDFIKAGSTFYYRVVDVRVPTQYRAGYVTGCVSYGIQ